MMMLTNRRVSKTRARRTDQRSIKENPSLNHGASNDDQQSSLSARRIDRLDGMSGRRRSAAANLSSFSRFRIRRRRCCCWLVDLIVDLLAFLFLAFIAAALSFFLFSIDEDFLSLFVGC